MARFKRASTSYLANKAACLEWDIRETGPYEKIAKAVFGMLLVAAKVV